MIREREERRGHGSPAVATTERKDRTLLLCDQGTDHSCLFVAWHVAVKLVGARASVDRELLRFARIDIDADVERVDGEIMRQGSLIMKDDLYIGTGWNCDLRRIELQFSRFASSHGDLGCRGGSARW